MGINLGMSISGHRILGVLPAALAAYAAAGITPQLVADFKTGTYGKAGAISTFDGVLEHSRASAATYVDSTGTLQTAASGVARENHHVWNGSAWVKEGYLHKPEAATNLLLNSDTLSTQSVTVTAEPHTLHFTGTGTVTLSGAATGSLVGTGVGEQNRVNLTFTPTAGSLTLTVTGSVTFSQLEIGSVPTSYIPTSGSTVTRAADILTLPIENIPYPTGGSLAVSFGYKSLVTYADRGTNELKTLRWFADSGNLIDVTLRTFGGDTGGFRFQQASGGVYDVVDTDGSAYSPGINVPISIASRHGSTFINGAVDGTALTANTTPTAFSDLSTTDLVIAPSGGPQVIQEFIMWGEDIGDTGIAEASALLKNSRSQ
jgi:hypothetical protein